jgi:hypothetical protein
MPRLLVALALGLSACHPDADAAPVPDPLVADPRPVPKASVSQPVPEASPAPLVAPAALNLPALDPDPATVPAPGDPPPPTLHRLPDGRTFIHDGHRDRIAVRDAAGRDHDLGEAVLVAVPRLGWLIAPKTDPGQFHDVDPAAPRLRPLWAQPTDPDPAVHVRISLAGLDRGAPLFLVRRLRQPPASARLVAATTSQLVRVAAPGRVETRAIELPPDLHVPGSDAVRDRRLLLVGADIRRGDPPSPWDTPFTAEVTLLDLETLALRRLGEAVGAWTRTTAVPHPYLAVRWTDHAAHARDHGWAERCINHVDPHDDSLTPCSLPSQIQEPPARPSPARAR